MLCRNSISKGQFSVPIKRKQMEMLKIRLKIREEDREIEVSAGETIELMKKNQFPKNKVRIIFQGKELKDHETFLSSGIKDKQVLHVMIQSGAPIDSGASKGECVTRIPSPPDSSQDLDNLDLLLLTFVLCFSVGWLLIVFIPDFVSSQSMSMMTLLSIGLTIALFFRFRRS
jgi:hypothetical protein